MSEKEAARDLHEQEPGRGNRHASAAGTPDMRVDGGLYGDHHHETSDHYIGVQTYLCPVHRVITCRDDLQWILQRRKKGGAERPWRGVGYFRTRNALIRVSATLCGRN